MRKLLLAIFLMVCASTSAFARAKFQGYAERGGNTVTTANMVSTTKVQRSYPSSTYTVYIAGTLTLATLYSDVGGTAKANPSTTDVNGFYSFYTDVATVDILFAPVGVSSWTLSGLSPNSGTTASAIYISVKDYGALGDGTTDDTAAIQAAINVSGPHWVVFPSGTYKVTDTLTISQHRVNISGVGQQASIVSFAPASGGKPVFSFTAGASVLYECSLQDLAISSADSTYQKIAIRLTDTSKFHLERVAVGSQFHGPGLLGAGTSIALQIRGRELGVVKDVTLSSDQPISIEDNPNTAQVLDLDQWHFQDVYTLATGTNPHWKFASGIQVSDFLLDHAIGTDNGLSLGTGSGDYFHWVDGAPAAIAGSYGFTVRNARMEGAVGGTAYFANLQPTGLTHVLFEACHTGTTNLNKGWYLRHVANVTLVNSYFQGNAAEAFNADSTCDQIRFINTQFLAGSTMTMTGLKQVFALGHDAGSTSPAWVDELWVSSANGNVGHPSKFGAGSGTATIYPSGVLNTVIAASGTDAALTEKDLWTYTLPANTMLYNGATIHVRARGVFAANANAKTIRLYFGGTLIAFNDVTASPNGVSWSLDAEIIRTGAATEQTAINIKIGSVVQSVFASNAVAVNTAVDAIVKITGQNGIASANDIQCYGAGVEFIPAGVF